MNAIEHTGIAHSASVTERERLARELHRTTSQYLVALELHLAHLRRSQIADLGPILDEMNELVGQVHRSIRDVASASDRFEERDGLGASEIAVAKAFYSLRNLDPSELF
jgi:signal transduction histidine kinase